MSTARSFSMRRAGVAGLVTASIVIAACSSPTNGTSASTSTSTGTGGGGGTGGDTGAGGMGGGGGIGGGAEIWEWCPKAEEYVGDPTWTWPVEVKGDALFCATFNENKTLEETLATKAQMRIIEGTYKVPSTDGKGPLVLPYCVRFLADGAHPLIKGSGEVAVSFNEFGGETSYSLGYNQPMATAAAEAWEAGLSWGGPHNPASPAPLIVDGSFNDSASTVNRSLTLCKGDCKTFAEFRNFNSCTAEGASTHVHTIGFEGGSVELTLRIGTSFASTEPGAFIKAAGKLDGSSFDQRSYWKLIYVPEHHHFTRHFAVLFDAPIGSACGIKIENVLSDGMMTRAALIDCKLQDIEERKVLSEDHQKQP